MLRFTFRNHTAQLKEAIEKHERTAGMRPLAVRITSPDYAVLKCECAFKHEALDDSMPYFCGIPLIIDDTKDSE